MLPSTRYQSVGHSMKLEIGAIFRKPTMPCCSASNNSSCNVLHSRHKLTPCVSTNTPSRMTAGTMTSRIKALLGPPPAGALCGSEASGRLESPELIDDPSFPARCRVERGVGGSVSYLSQATGPPSTAKYYSGRGRVTTSTPARGSATELLSRQSWRRSATELQLWRSPAIVDRTAATVISMPVGSPGAHHTGADPPALETTTCRHHSAGPCAVRSIEIGFGGQARLRLSP